MYTSFSDAELHTALVAGVSEAQKEYYNRFSPTLYAVCLRYSGSKSESKDLLHDTLIKIFGKIKDLKNPDLLKPWSVRVAVNTALSHHRAGWKKYLSALDDTILFIQEEKDAAVIEDAIEVEEDYQPTVDQLMEMMGTISPKYRVVLNMYAIDGYSHKAIAQELGITQNTSKSLLHRARKMMRSAIEDSKKNNLNTSFHLLTHTIDHVEVA